jgi:hypothetical protein
MTVFSFGTPVSGGEDTLAFRLGAGPVWSRYTRRPPIASIPEAGFTLASQAGLATELGLELTFMFPGNVAIVHSLGYMQKGTALDWFYGDDPLGTQTYRLGLLEYSTFLKIRPIPKFGAYVLSGIAMSYILSHKLTDGLASPPFPVSDLMEATRRFGFGLLAGAGGELAFKRCVAFIEARYNWGLLDLSKGTGPLQNYSVIRTRALTLLAGIRFALAKGPA